MKRRNFPNRRLARQFSAFDRRRRDLESYKLRLANVEDDDKRKTLISKISRAKRDIARLKAALSKGQNPGLDTNECM